MGVCVPAPPVCPGGRAFWSGIMRRRRLYDCWVLLGRPTVQGRREIASVGHVVGEGAYTQTPGLTRIHTHTHTGGLRVACLGADKLDAALQCLAREDPSLVVREVCTRVLCARVASIRAHVSKAPCPCLSAATPTCPSGQRDLRVSQKRPACITKETCVYDKRDLRVWPKSAACTMQSAHAPHLHHLPRSDPLSVRPLVGQTACRSDPLSVRLLVGQTPCRWSALLPRLVSLSYIRVLHVLHS